MFSAGEGKKWTRRKAGLVSLQKVASLVRDLREPCLSQSRIQVVLTIGKMLKPEKWQALFDGDGKVSSFHKALKLIILGGIDPSIRAEVWEFLLGCYALSSTSEYRTQLRVARRLGSLFAFMLYRDGVLCETQVLWKKLNKLFIIYAENDTMSCSSNAR
jgi:hypothetical protein